MIFEYSHLMRSAFTLLTLFLLSTKLSCLVEAQDIKQLRLSAEQGDEASQFKLGVMYDNGTDVQKDDQEAAKWYELAAEQGNASAQFSLGSLLAFGDPSIRDYVKAVLSFQMAAEPGPYLST